MEVGGSDKKHTWFINPITQPSLMFCSRHEAACMHVASGLWTARCILIVYIAGNALYIYTRLAGCLKNPPELGRARLCRAPCSAKHAGARLARNAAEALLAHAACCAILVKGDRDRCSKQWGLKCCRVRKEVCAVGGLVVETREETHDCRPKEYERGRRPRGSGNVSLESQIVCRVSSLYFASGRRAACQRQLG